MRTNKIKVLTVVTLLGCGFVVNAQEDNKLSREMTLEREYDPTVQDANKVNRLPEVKEPVVTKRPIDYSPFTIATDPKKEITLLPSGDIMTEIPYNKRRGYFHFGGGMFMNLNGDLGYHLLDDASNKLNLFFTHHSTNGNVDFSGTDAYLSDQTTGLPEKQKAKLNDNLGGLGFLHLFDKSALHLGANYGYTAFNYYGAPLYLINPYSSVGVSDSLLDRETNQVNQTLRAYGGIQSKEGVKTGYLLDFEWLNFS
ncbi:MAG: TonB-dependent receptor, partial [Tannerella sp.]|nr:TonB-dependent receptor [Tannerella sp.]